MSHTPNEKKTNRKSNRNEDELLETQVDQEADNLNEVEQSNDEQLDLKHLAPVYIVDKPNKWPEPNSYPIDIERNVNFNGVVKKDTEIFNNYYKYNKKGHFVWTNQLVNQISNEPLVKTGDAPKNSKNKIKRLKATGCDLKNPEKSFYLKRVENLGLGLFAKHGIPKGQCVGEYTGELITLEEKNKREAEYKKRNLSSYFYKATDDEQDYTWIIDGQAMGNHTRFINHRCDPNCTTKSTTVGGFPRRWIIATKSIDKGEQLYLNYGINYFTDAGFKCQCSTLSCFGNDQEDNPENNPEDNPENSPRRNQEIPPEDEIEENESVIVEDMRVVPKTKEMGEGNTLLKQQLTAKGNKNKRKRTVNDSDYLPDKKYKRDDASSDGRKKYGMRKRT